MSQVPSASFLIKEQINLEEEELQSLEKQVSLEEKSSQAIATARTERKVKSGVSSSLLAQHQRQIDAANAKKESELSKIKNKVETLEERHRLATAEFERKKEVLENEKSLVEAACEKTLNYFTPLVERCYEPLVVDPSLPPSYYKKVERVKELKASIATKKSLLEKVKRAEAGLETSSGVSPLSEKKEGDTHPKISSEESQEAAKSSQDDLKEIMERISKSTEDYREELAQKTIAKYAPVEEDLRRQREAARAALEKPPAYPPVLQSSRPLKQPKVAKSAEQLGLLPSRGH